MIKMSNRKLRADIKQKIKLFDQVEPKIQRILYVYGAAFSLYLVIVTPLSDALVGHGWLWTLVFKLIIYALVLFHYTVITYSPFVWLRMVEVAPQAMLHFQLVRILIHFLRQLIAFVVKSIKLKAKGQLARKRQFSGGKYSLASIFSLSAVPYRLYPLSCCLLE